MPSFQEYIYDLRSTRLIRPIKAHERQDIRLNLGQNINQSFGQNVDVDVLFCRRSDRDSKSLSLIERCWGKKTFLTMVNWFYIVNRMPIEFRVLLKLQIDN